MFKMFHELVKHLNKTNVYIYLFIINVDFILVKIMNISDFSRKQISTCSAHTVHIINNIRFDCFHIFFLFCLLITQSDWHPEKKSVMWSMCTFLLIVLVGKYLFYNLSIDFVYFCHICSVDSFIQTGSGLLKVLVAVSPPQHLLFQCLHSL